LEKLKAVAAWEAEGGRSGQGVKRRRKASLRVGDKTSERELLLANPVKPSKKSEAKETEARSSGLSTAKKASAAKGSSHPILGYQGRREKDAPSFR
jgi:hypothetical protein